MPCDMGMGGNYDQGARTRAESALDRVAHLEEAMCGLCQMFDAAGYTLHPQLLDWFDKHKAKPGCTVTR